MDKSVLLNLSIGIAQVQQLWIVYKNVSYVKVVGLKKFLKNMQNLIDVLLSALYTIYSIERIYEIIARSFDGS